MCWSLLFTPPYSQLVFSDCYYLWILALGWAHLQTVYQIWRHHHDLWGDQRSTNHRFFRRWSNCINEHNMFYLKRPMCLPLHHMTFRPHFTQNFLIQRKDYWGWFAACSITRRGQTSDLKEDDENVLRTAGVSTQAGSEYLSSSQQNPVAFHFNTICKYGVWAQWVYKPVLISRDTVNSQPSFSYY